MIANKSQGLKFKEKQTPKIKNRCTLIKRKINFIPHSCLGNPKESRSGLLIKAKRFMQMKVLVSPWKAMPQ
jgi:hypothetical protein